MNDSLLLWLVYWLVRASCMKLCALGNTFSVVYRYPPTTNGGTRMTEPKQTTDSSLIIMYLICSYAKRSLMNNSNCCDFISFPVLVL